MRNNKKTEDRRQKTEHSNQHSNPPFSKGGRGGIIQDNHASCILKRMGWHTKINLALILVFIFSMVIYKGGLLNPKVEIAEAASGDVLMLWDLANGAIPGGWTQVAALNTYFLRGAASYTGIAGGSATHTHTVTNAVSTATATMLAGGTNANKFTPAHTHTATIGGLSGSNLPQYRNLVVISATNPASLPQNIIGIFDAAPPSGWTQYNSQNGYFIRADNASGTGGNTSNQHSHTATITLTAYSTVTQKSATTSSVSLAHNHTVSNQTANTVTYQPPYINVILATANSNGTSLPTGLIALFDATPPANWTSLSGTGGAFENRFIKAAATYGSPSGGGTHTHNDITGIASTAADTTGIFSNGAGADGTAGSHTHTVDLTAFSTITEAASLPPYMDVIVAKYTAPAAAGSLQFTSATFSIAEGGGSVNLTVSRTGGSSGAVSVECATDVGGNATGGGVDYTFTSPTTLNWADNDSTDKNCTVTITSDSIDESDETANFKLQNAIGGATIGAQSTTQLTITDDDAQPSVQWTAASQASVGESGTMTVTAQLSTASGLEVTVPYTVTGTATGSGTDYSITASPITITAGSTTGTATITIATDTLDENNETVILTIGTPTNATKGATDVHTATITDDDAQPSVQWTAASQASVGESGTMTVTAQLSTASGLEVTVPYTVTGTATGSGTDYSITASPITITAGSTTGTATITIATDTLDENDETVILTIGTPTNATKGATDVHTATITDDDAAPTVAFTLATSNGSEATTPAVMAVTLSAQSGKTVTVTYNTADGTATAGSDYTAVSGGTLTFTPGVTSQNINITITNDSTPEPDETFTVTLSSPTNATLGAITTHTYTINNDDAAGPSLSPPTETGYTDYKNPDSGDTTTNTFRFKAIYTSANTPNYMRVCIGDNDDSTSYPCYDMTADTGCAAPYCDGDNSNGEQYVYGPIGLGAAQDIRFYFEANDVGGTTKLPSNAPTSYYTGPAVYLLWTYNRVGVPKCLGASCTAGLPYSSVLGDDSGYNYCYDYKLVSACDYYCTTYANCASSNVKTGKGYWIWAKNANTYRLDEKNSANTDLAGNVPTSPFSIIIGCYQGGSYKSWNMISNPYNKRIPLEGASGPRVMVEKITVDANCNETAPGSEVTFGTAVSLPNEWVGNAIYEWEGPVNAEVPRLYSDSATVLEPWVGYWIWANLTQSGYAIKLKVYKE